MSKYYNESEFLHVDDIYALCDRYHGEGQIPETYTGKVVDKKGNRVIFGHVSLFETTGIIAIPYSDKELAQREKQGLLNVDYSKCSGSFTSSTR